MARRASISSIAGASARCTSKSTAAAMEASVAMVVAVV